MFRPVSQEGKTRLSNRLQFAIVLVLFFPVLLGALYQAGSDTGSANTLTLKWGLVIATLIVDYFFLEALKEVCSEWIITIVNALIMLEIGLMGVVIYVLAAVQFGSISWLYVYPFIASAFGISVVPVGILIVLAFNLVYVNNQDIIAGIHHFLKTRKFR